MNIIEKLGGYEDAKESYEWLKQKGYCGSHVDDGALEVALLEYRRQHNIFEEGDLVVEIVESPETSILKVIYMSDRLMVCENDNLNASYGVLNKKPSFYVRHATEEEIKVGHRL